MYPYTNRPEHLWETQINIYKVSTENEIQNPYFLRSRSIPRHQKIAVGTQLEPGKHQEPSVL